MTRLVFLIALLAPVAPQSQSASLTGAWRVSSNVSGTQSDQTCTFTQKDAALTGTCDGDRGTVSIAGQVDGKTVTWQFEMEYEGQKLTPVYSGTLESPEKIVGTVDVRGMGVGGEFTATKAK
jgi:hypothetical protein